MYEEIKTQAINALKELLEVAKLSKGDIFVVGCSSSEIVGQHIGKGSDINAAEAVFEGIYPILKEKGIYLAGQCCEHLNRSIILEKECAIKYGYDEVNVVPQQHAGGGFATTCWHNFINPCAVEEVRASAGMDIGRTLIGMHLKRVAVPVRLSMDHIGSAVLICARTRPPFVGGSRAMYDESRM